MQITFSYRFEALAYLPCLNKALPSSFFLAAASIFSAVLRSHDSFSWRYNGEDHTGEAIHLTKKMWGKHKRITFA